MNLRQTPYLSEGTLTRARDLRRDATDAERSLWHGLREKLPDARFRRQVPMGAYFADFASHGANLVVEVDGRQHADAAGYDEARTLFLIGQGYRVLRFWNNEVTQNLDGVLTVIAANLPSPPVGEGGPKGRMRGARQSRAPASTAGTHVVPGSSPGRALVAPHPLPSPTRGEGESDKPTVWSL